MSPGAVSGPPSIGLDELDRHNELDLGGGGGGSLELDLSGAPQAAEPLPGIDLPEDLQPGDSGLDLPSPVGVSATGVREDSNAYALDLPVPVDARPAPTFGRPAAPPPARPPAAPPTTPSFAGPPGVEPLSFDDDLPMPVELDLPTPAGAPRVGDQDDLLVPVDHSTPSHHQMMAPVGQDVRPIELGVTPANLGVAPANLGLEPKLAGNELAPHDLPALQTDRAASAEGPSRAPKTPSGPVAAASPATRSVPTPGSIAPRRGLSRGVMLVAVGLLVVGLAGVGVLASGVLDPEDPEPASLRGAGKPPGAKTNGDTKTDDPMVLATGAPTERTAAVLAKMAAHTPEAYLEARTTAREAGDGVGMAEAALLVAFHFGPNPARAQEAAKALEPHANNSAPFVQRVVGLASLLAGDDAGADAALVGDEPRTRLYRGWLRLSQGRLDDAKTEADAVLDELPDELGARHLALAVQAQRDPSAAVIAIQAALQANPNPALRGLHAATALTTGQLALARASVDALDPAATDDPGVQAWIHVQQGRVRAAQGDHDAALAAFDRALERVPQEPALQMDRIGVLLAAKRWSDASKAASVLVREHPRDQEAQLLQAQVAIQGGDGDIALQVLDKLAAARPSDARVVLAKGQVHAMRLEVEEGRTAFAAARALDPLLIQASIDEAVLLADAKRLPDALEVLRSARTTAEAAGRSDHVARLWVTKAKLHSKIAEHDAALEALDRALEAAPGDNEAQLRRGVLRLELGREREGYADLLAVFERTGGYPGLTAPLGRQYVREGDFDALERLVGNRLQGEQTPDDLLTLGARLRLHQGHTADARTLLERALVRRPADWEAHMLLAQVLILEGKTAQALAEIDRARPATPQPEHMLQRGKILEFNGRHDDAIPEYQRALSLDPDLHEVRFLYGRMLHHKGGHARAIAELRKVLDQPQAKAAPWYPEVWLNIGVALQAQGKYEVAIESLRKATDLDPKLGEAWAKAGKFHADRNKSAEAIAALEKAVEIGTTADHWYADALMDLGRAQAKAGKKAAARTALEEFLRVASPVSTSRPEAERLLGEL